MIFVNFLRFSMIFMVVVSELGRPGTKACRSSERVARGGRWPQLGRGTPQSAQRPQITHRNVREASHIDWSPKTYTMS